MAGILIGSPLGWSFGLLMRIHSMLKCWSFQLWLQIRRKKMRPTSVIRGQLSSSSSLAKLRLSWLVSLSLRNVCLIASSSDNSRRTFSRWKARRFWICRMGNGFMSTKAIFISFLQRNKLLAFYCAKLFWLHQLTLTWCADVGISFSFDIYKSKRWDSSRRYKQLSQG